MTLQIIEYKGSTVGFSPDKMYGDGLWSEDGWIAIVGICCNGDHIELERRIGYRSEKMSARGLESIWKKWQKLLKKNTGQ